MYQKTKFKIFQLKTCYFFMEFYYIFITDLYCLTKINIL